MKIGTTDIKEMFLGTTEVKKIFSGTTLLYEKLSTPRYTTKIRSNNLNFSKWRNYTGNRRIYYITSRWL